MSSSKDIYSPKIKNEEGASHPVTQTKENILRFLISKGFQEVDGPEIETEEFNFDKLNIHKLHPARQMHDTFYVNNKEFVLRTHTSPVQIRSMLSRTPPLALISAGKVYRKDDDSTHLPMFQQIEGIFIDENVSFANLKDMIYEILYFLFGFDINLRFRPSYFPFTEPSAEVDILDSKGEWLEVLGCGIVNPIVIENCELDPKTYSGFAFGIGIERIAMLKFKIRDIRELYKSNLDFLSQFK